ncbi:MAG TPA: hypothetical protein VMF65_14650 [Acidimicrobiales bacterium]|nr:hypothetical protein [Acidimicrobiales bacterium]
MKQVVDAPEAPEHILRVHIRVAIVMAKDGEERSSIAWPEVVEWSLAPVL